MKKLLTRVGYLIRAAGAATLLGLIETFSSQRGRRILALVGLGGLAVLFYLVPPVRAVQPGEMGVRVNRWTGSMTVLEEGPALFVPGVHQLKRYSVRNQVYRPVRSAMADGEAPFKSVEGLSIGVEVAVQWALDPARIARVARTLPENIGRDLIAPTVDNIVHRTLARHTVREIFSAKRVDIQLAVESELRDTLRPEGVLVRSVMLGSVDLPKDYKAGLDGLLAEELSAEKMRYTLELKEKMVKQTALESQADKVRRETAAEAAGREQIISAKANAEAMKHILPFKEKEIEQRRLEAEAAKVQRLKRAEAEAESRRIEMAAEADGRRKLAEAEAFRIEVTGKATSDQLARDSALIAKNPLLIQKTLADKLSDKIQVIVAPPSASGFFAGSLIRTSAGKGEE